MQNSHVTSLKALDMLMELPSENRGRADLQLDFGMLRGLPSPTGERLLRLIPVPSGWLWTASPVHIEPRTSGWAWTIGPTGSGKSTLSKLLIGR